MEIFHRMIIRWDEFFLTNVCYPYISKFPYTYNGKNCARGKMVQKKYLLKIKTPSAFVEGVFIKK